MKNNSLLISAIFALTLSNIVSASSDDQESNGLSEPLTQVYATQYQAEDWGLAMGIRRGDIPYAVDDDSVNDILPLIKFRNDYFFINGMEAGAHIWKNENHQVNAYTRFRFVDIPTELQNESQSQAFDFGLQYRFLKGPWEADVAFMADSNKRSYGYSRTKYHWESGDWYLSPYAELNWKSADFNQFYYGLEQYDTSGGVAVNAGVTARYHLASNLYLLGKFGVGRLEDDIVNLPSIDSQYQYESFFGFGFYPDSSKKKVTNSHSDSNSPSAIEVDSGDEFIRVAHGWATPSNLNAILTWHAQTDPYNNQLTSIFYGTRLTETLFTLPIELYFTPGAVWHHDSEVQGNLAEGVVAIKAFYTFELGPRWRLGVAEGLSYVSSVTHIEGIEMEEKGYKPSKLLNYLDFSLDVNMGDLFMNNNLSNMWMGYSIHHRSGIYENSSAFGRIGGGSNYQTLYLQWHF